jgi:cation:H+ antiporter
MNDVLTWLTFFASAAVVVAAGSRLARSGDRIAKETGIGGLWIGVVLIAGATSLPEIVTDVTAAWIEEPDLAIGDLFGSSMANMMVLAIIDLMHRQRRVWQSVSLGHTLVAGLAIALSSVAAAFMTADLGWSIGHVGVDTIGLALLYLLGARVVFRHQYLEARLRIAAKAAAGSSGGDEPGELGLRLPSRGSLIAFGAGAAFILAAAPFPASRNRSSASRSWRSPPLSLSW